MTSKLINLKETVSTKGRTGEVEIGTTKTAKAKLGQDAEGPQIMVKWKGKNEQNESPREVKHLEVNGGRWMRVFVAIRKGEGALKGCLFSWKSQNWPNTKICKNKIY